MQAHRTVSIDNCSRKQAAVGDFHFKQCFVSITVRNHQIWHQLRNVLIYFNCGLIESRHSTRPKELVCEISSRCEATHLELKITDRVHQLYNYLLDHRYDPTEYYGEQDYLKEIPNPCLEPIDLLEEYIQIIQNFGNYFTCCFDYLMRFDVASCIYLFFFVKQMHPYLGYNSDSFVILGPWGADRAALVYLIHLEKLKTKAVYERHYLLLCLVFTVLLEIRLAL